MVKRTCEWRGCKKTFLAKAADVRRGWGRFCCKRCKAMEQESRTGQNAQHQKKMKQSSSMEQSSSGEWWLVDFGNDWDNHKEWR